MLKANKKDNRDVFTGSTALTNTLLIHLQFKMSNNGGNNAFKVKPTSNNVRILFLEVKTHL